MAISNITSVTSSSPPMQRQGAIVHAVAHVQEYKVHYGVQSATFTPTVFPGQATGTYRLNGMIPTWQKAQITALPGTVSSSRSAGSPPNPYPPRNASAYYSTQYTRIIPNPCYSCYKAYG